MKRIRRLLLQPERPAAPLAPIISALLVLAFAGISIANQPKPGEPLKPKPTAPVAVHQGVPQAAKPAVVQMAQAAPQKEIRTPDLTTAWKKWLNEDVAYIISNEECAAFESLAEDQERERFIEQFWQRRDPTPGTDENEYKQEHYRRIAYTNEHFSDKTQPGWKTDRGRIYISFGPPDEIDSHPSGGQYLRPESQGGGSVDTSPFEQWKYRFLDGIGYNVIIEFVATGPDGAYRMTMDPHQKERAAK